jgi:nitrate reductase delta subunit
VRFFLTKGQELENRKEDLKTKWERQQMDEHTKFQMKIISLLLQYPDDGFIRSLPLMETGIEGLPNSFAGDKLAQFIFYLRATPLLRLQEIYTETFDLNPSTCLNLSYHLFGDSEKRGNVMACLQQIYHEAGYETITGELPDYLPLMMEFLSECPESGGAGMVWSYLESIEKPAALLKDSVNPYSLLLDVVVDIVRTQCPRESPMEEGRAQKSEGRGPEIRSRKSEVRGQGTEDGKVESKKLRR